MPDDPEKYVGCLITNGQIYHTIDPFMAMGPEDAEGYLLTHASEAVSLCGHPDIDRDNMSLAIRRLPEK